MSKNKKGAKSHSEDTSWDEGLVNEKIYDDFWYPFLMFLVPDNADTDVQLQALESVVKNGNRKKFSYISKRDILQTAQEDAKNSRNTSGTGGKKSKQSSTPTVFKPQHVQVCEHVANVISSGEPVSPSLAARMIKYMILKRRTKEIAEKRAMAEGSDPDLKKEKKSGGTSSGRTSKAATKKGKETPLINDSAPNVHMPTKHPTLMKKRGEEDADSKYLHDEPEAGPSCYYILTGFNSAELLKHLAPLKLKADALVKVSSKEVMVPETPVMNTKRDKAAEVTNDEVQEREELNQTLKKFWLEVDSVVRSSESGSVLRDMAKLHLDLKSHLLPNDEAEKRDYCQDIFDEVAECSFLLLEQYTQYKHYLEFLDLVNLSPYLALEETPLQDKPDMLSLDTVIAIVPEPDMRYYHDILRALPQDNITIPVILHSMVEQVSVTLSEVSRLGPSSTTNFNPVTAEFANMMEHLSLSDEDKQFLGVKTEPEETKKTPDQIIIPNGDEVTMRTIGVCKSNANFEESTIKLAGHNSLLTLAPSNSPTQKACVHTLNHLLHGHENLTVTKFNHFLILLSLENLGLHTASTPPTHSFVNPLLSPLLFDHPFDLEIATTESSIVPLSEFNPSTDWPTQQEPSYALQLEKPPRNMEEYSVLEVFEFSGLLQELRSLQFTHPYMEMFEHQHSHSLILVVHTGFDGTPIHRHKLSSHTHTKVGFQNYLQFVSEQYSQFIDEAVEGNERRKKEYEEERKAMAARRMKELEERRKEAFATLEEEQASGSGKTKKSAASSKPNPTLRKSVISSTIDTISSISELRPSEVCMQPFQVEKQFTGYDMGDVVLLKESIHTTLFTSDGVQVQSKRHLMTDGAPEPFDVSLLHNGHRVVCSQVRITDSSTLYAATNTDTDSGANSPTDVIPQPPPELKYASLKACFNNSLHVSFSHYGPKGNGEFPYLPYRPKILDHNAQSDHLQAPATQPGVSPKLSKKQQEHQQQLLEQQRAQEVLMEKERQVAQMRYNQQYDTLVRNNKHQRLSIGTEYGLDVQCHVSLDYNTAADTVHAGGSIIIKQQYKYPETAALLNEHVSKEKCRFCHPDGYVVKCMKDDSVVILSSDGASYRSATAKEVELFAKYKSTMKLEAAQQKKGDLDMAEVDKAAKKVTSSTKLKSAEKAEKAEKEKNVAPQPTTTCTPQGKIWAVTTSTGNRYLFEEEEPAHEAITEPPPSPELDNKENIEPAPSPANAQSNRVVMPLSSIHLLKATDPVTKEVYITREDKVVLVQCSDHSYISEFEDGTRFTVSNVQDETKTSALSEVTIECAGFAQVTYYIATLECSLRFPDDSVVICSNQGEYRMLREEDYELCIENNGEVHYKIPNASYILDHTSLDCVFHAVDGKGNKFSLHPNSEATIEPSSPEASSPIEHAAFAPRYFQLSTEQLGFELHKSSAVELLIAEAASNPKVAVVKDTLPSEPYITSTTLIEPVLAPEVPPSVTSLWDNSIVPYNLRNGEFVPPSMATPHKGKKKPKFGSLVGKGLEIGSLYIPRPKSATLPPPGLKYRQFLHIPPLDSDTREDIHELVISYINQRQVQLTTSENMQPTETREESEVKLAENLNTKSMESKMGEVYESVMMRQRKKSSLPVPASMSQEGLEFIKKSKDELKAAHDTQMSLRNRDIPPYFQSKYVQQYLPIKQPDMSYLTAKLAHPPAAPEPNTKSQSSLQSSSLTFTMDESDSVFPGEHRRHTHPASKCTLEKAVSPIDMRPINPTPMKAVTNDTASYNTASYRLGGSTVVDAESSTDKEVISSKLNSTLLDVTGKLREKAVPRP